MKMSLWMMFIVDVVVDDLGDTNMRRWLRTDATSLEAVSSLAVAKIMKSHVSWNTNMRGCKSGSSPRKTVLEGYPSRDGISGIRAARFVRIGLI